MKKIALFGGNFNPVHNGHVDVVKKALASGEVDEVWLLPNTKAQFEWEATDNELRVDMLSLAFEGFTNVKLCRENLDFLGMSDVYSTLNRLKSKFGSKYEFVWLGGSDLCYEAIKWYRYMEVFRMIDFIIYERGNFPYKEVDGMNVRAVLKSDIRDVTPKEIRLLVFEGHDIKSYVPRKVFDYIVKHYMYTKRATRVVY